MIVDALRAAGRLSVPMVALSPVLIDGRDERWFGLGPLSVAPMRQRQRIGSALTRNALARLRASGAARCFVLGDPAYYARFGLRTEGGR
ncbi:GNAT family N-acetyltransferase [Caballeronia sp. RCC_10]|uniref:GNAT family N-acetyltransferase n=1 Tax=Caballeronia sp. RCC_10 TaxID=3239227 RepID=UPI00352418BE